jgi:anaerobic magnesium-protoporphyrin IX monomethyl ester cyclase
MKVLLVCKSKMMENLGVMYLSAVVKKAGHEAKIVDINEAYNIAEAYRPDIVGYSVMTGDQLRFVTLNRDLRTCLPFSFVSIAGGPHATFFPKDFLEGEFDLCIPGEGENFMAEYLGGEENAYPDIDSIPWPDRTDFPGMKIRDFISSRGCPFDCSYCYNGSWAKMFPDVKRVRTRSVTDVINEINSVDPEFVYFQDSCFGVDMRWLRKFSRLYENKINIPFHCHLRPDQVKEERVMLLREAGCYSVRIALETASKDLRKLIGRERTSNEETIKASWLLRKWNIKLMIQNILALPSSTIEDDLATLEVNIRCHPDYGWSSVFVPYPGTALGDKCVKEGWYKGDYSEISDTFFDASVLEFSEERKEQSECLQKVFALCTEVGYLPKVEELTYENFPKLVHKIMRKQGDNRLYGGVI